MNRLMTFTAIKGLISLLILVSVLPGPFLTSAVFAGGVQSSNSGSSSQSKVKRSHDHKIAPDLDEEVAEYGKTKNADHVKHVILEFNDAVDPTSLAGKLARLNGHVKDVHGSLRLASADLPLSRIHDLQADAEIAYVSPDRPLEPSSHLETTTGAAQVRGILGDKSLDGAGVGVAVIDSGIDTTHDLTTTFSGHPGVVYQKDFTGAKVTGDPDGHGTFVASVLSGAAQVGPAAGGAYNGIAPGARLISLRVLDANGTGRVSSAISAIQWCILYKSKYNIRIINLSIGTLAKDSYQNDPLCVAARSANDAGIVVVAAAGNQGRGPGGSKLYGGIHSPGIDPSVITVGASNSFGTDRRSDDTVTTFSSRGPTRGYYIDFWGVKHFDNLIKPDLIAPGNKLVGASSPNNGLPNSLISKGPNLQISPTSAVADRLMYLSGTSVSVPAVSGAAALMLQANPTLTPNLVKAILMYTAQPMVGANTLEQGAGEIDIDGAVRIAHIVSSKTAKLSTGDPMLTSPLPDSQASIIAGENCAWGQGVITDYYFLYGSNLMTEWQGMYATGALLADATFDWNGVMVQNRSLVARGISNSGGVVQNSGVLLRDGFLLEDGALLSDGVILNDGVIIADGVLVSDGVLISDGVILNDGVLVSDAAPIP